MTDKKRVDLVCPRCGSDHVGRDANAIWNASSQEFELGGVFDNGWCQSCDWEGDDAFVEIDLTALPDSHNEDAWIALGKAAQAKPETERSLVDKYLIHKGISEFWLAHPDDKEEQP